MSFYIGFVSKDLIALAADRKFRCLSRTFKGEPIEDKTLEADKLVQLNRSMWGVHIGAKFFGEKWLDLFSHIVLGKSLINTYTGLKLVSRLMYIAYLYHREKMRQHNLALEGFNNIAVAGFRKDKPFIYAMDSSNRFRPELCYNGSIYSRTERDEGKADLYIKVVTRAWGELQKESVDQQKEFLRAQIAKIFKYLNEKHDCISAAGDIVFITPEDSIRESFNR